MFGCTTLVYYYARFLMRFPRFFFCFVFFRHHRLDLGQTSFHGRDSCIISLLCTAGPSSLNGVMAMAVECSASSPGEVSLAAIVLNTHNIDAGFLFLFSYSKLLFILWNNSHIFDQPIILGEFLTKERFNCRHFSCCDFENRCSDQHH